MGFLGTCILLNESGDQVVVQDLFPGSVLLSPDGSGIVHSIIQNEYCREDLTELSTALTVANSQLVARRGSSYKWGVPQAWESAQRSVGGISHRSKGHITFTVVLEDGCVVVSACGTRCRSSTRSFKE